jgi:predicted porin
MLHEGRFVLRAACGIVASLLGGAAYAQSSVSVYGLLDTGLLYTSKTLGSTGSENAGKSISLIEGGVGPSNFGFAGTEDLGGGLRVNFKLESGISTANGGFADCNGNLFGCQAWVALNSQYGMVKAGLQFSPFFTTLEESDPRDFSLFGSGVVNYVGNVLGTSIFNPNAVSYTSPEIAGLQGSAMLALGGIAGDFQDGRQYAASLKYERGGLMINASIYDGNAGGNAQTPTPTTLEFEGRTIGAAYKFGAITAKVSFVNYKVAGSFNNNVYGGGVDYHIAPTFELNGGVWVTSDRDHTTNHSIMGALGANYFLSRRTSLYAQVGAVNNHGAMDTGISVNGALYAPEGTTIAALVGMRHTF